MFHAKSLLVAFALLMAPVAWANEDAAPTSASAAPERISFLVTFGDEKCPEGVDGEIVVCAPAPEGDRYRIPKKLRAGHDVVSSGGSWTAAVESLDEHASDLRPNSCSVNGSGGFTGCTQAMLRQWFAERRGLSKAN